MATDPVSPILLNPLFTKLISSVAEQTKGPAAKAKDRLLVRFRSGFDEYIRKQIQKYSFVKTIIGGSIPLKLTDIYVNLRLVRETDTMRDDDIIFNIRQKKRFVFKATAGAGKSMLMRYLYFLALREQKDYLPIFIQLRDLNENPQKSLIELIRNEIGLFIEGFTADQLNYAMKKGVIMLILDGFDEIDHDKRTKRGAEINTICKQFINIPCFVAGRPDDAFKGWEIFDIYRVDDFSESQVRSLIAKIPYDDDQKSVFVRKLDGGLYETHREFLVNPLLTLMMLITIEQFSEVPAKIHLFYEHAFEALFARHDVTKIGFVRKRHVDLPLDDYRHLFSYFCVITYLKEAFRFSNASALSYFDQAISASQIKAKKTDILEDLTACTCMLVQDGLELSFSHRSFQEYFVAFFFARIRPDEFKSFAPKLVRRGYTDSVMILMSEMHKEKFEEDWALPEMNRIVQRLNAMQSADDVIELAAALWGANRLVFFGGKCI